MSDNRTVTMLGVVFVDVANDDIVSRFDSVVDLALLEFSSGVIVTGVGASGFIAVAGSGGVVGDGGFDSEDVGTGAFAGDGTMLSTAVAGTTDETSVAIVTD